MKSEWFDPTNNYLKNPPPVRIVPYLDFKGFYSDIGDKGKVLTLFEDLCVNMRKDGIIPMGFVLGGEFLRNSETTTSRLEYIIVLNHGYRVQKESLFKYAHSGGEKVAKYKSAIFPQGFIRENHRTLDEIMLSKDLRVEDFQQRTVLENSFHKAGVIAINFSEVGTNE